MAGNSSGKRPVRRVHKGRVGGCLAVFVLIFILISTLINGCTKKHKLEKEKKNPGTSVSTVTDQGSTSDNISVKKDKYIIIVDPGHGGEDIGSSNGDRLEKVDNLRYASCVYEELLTREGIEPIITRQSNDTYMDNEERADFANSKNADLYLALHRNKSDDSTANGLEIWVQQNPSVIDDVLGYKLEQGLTKVGVQYNRGVQHGYTSDEQNNFQIIEWTNMPACIIELGFISNDEDNRLFDAYYKDYARAIADAVESLCKEGYLDTVGTPD